MISGSVTGDKEVATRLRKLPPSLHDKLRRVVTASVFDLKAYVVSQKLSGQSLNRVTGTLAGSINTRIEEPGSSIFGRVGQLGSKSVPYAPIQEFGFSGPQTVKTHLRNITIAFGKSISPISITVNAHTRNVNIKEKRFMRDSLDENKTAFFAMVEKAMGQAVRE